MNGNKRGCFSEYALTLMAFVRLVRLPNCIALGLLFIAAKRHFGLTTGNSGEYLQAFLWVALSSFSYLYNDLVDIEIDRINKPSRPLASGKIRPQTAKITLGCLSLIIVVLIAAQWRTSLIWGTTAFLAGIVYSSFLRSRTPFLSNVVAGCLVAAVPLSGLTLESSRHWALTAGVFFLMFGRELQKDALDAKGDIHWRPIPLLLGRSARLVMILYPFILITSATFLFLATRSETLFSNTGTAMIVFLHIGALIAFFYNQRGYQLQAAITKTTSYLLVAALMIRG